MKAQNSHFLLILIAREGFEPSSKANFRAFPSKGLYPRPLDDRALYFKEIRIF